MEPLTRAKKEKEMLKRGISSIDFRLSLNSDKSRCVSFLVGGSGVYLHGTLEEMRDFVDSVDSAVADAIAKEDVKNG